MKHAAQPHLLTLAELATLLDVPASAVSRLVRAQFLTTVTRDPGEPRYTDADYQRLRLIIDLIDAGVSLGDIRLLIDARETFRLGSRTSKALEASIDALLGPLTARLERLRALREDLIQTREALYRCRSCHRTFDAMSCRTCAAMPRHTPRALSELFFPPKR